MAEQRDSEVTPDQRALSSIRDFVSQHGEPTRTVVERLGGAGARVVLVGADGAMGDVLVRDGVEAAEALVGAAGLEAGEWDSETVAATRIGPAHRRAMAGPRAKRS